MEHFDKLNVTFKSYLTDEKFYEQKPCMKKYQNEKVKYLVNSKRETQEQTIEDFKTNPEKHKIVKKLRKTQVEASKVQNIQITQTNDPISNSHRSIV
jgi:hypothetical protein